MRSGLRICDLNVRRSGTLAVNSVSIDAPPGSITALLGPNGAGKSSLVLACGGVIAATGAVHVDDAQLLGRSPERIRGAGLAIVPEGHRLLTTLTTADNLDIAAASRRRAEIGERRAQVAPSPSWPSSSTAALAP